MTGADTPKPRRKKKQRRPARRQFPWKLVAVACGVVALALVAAVGAMELFGVGVGGGFGDIAREPKPAGRSDRSDDSTVYDGEFLAADPASPDLRATTPCPDERGREVLALAFADPKAATAAAVYGRDNELRPPAWYQVALTGAGATKSVPLNYPAPGYGSPTDRSQLGLSPAGGRLATYGQFRKSDPNNTIQFGGFGVVVWNRDGSRLAEWAETETGGKPECQGVWFASEDRVLIAARGTLRCREAATGKLVYERPLKPLGDAALSPRRTWLFVGVEGGVEAVATADGASAGRLAVPGISAGGGTRLAVSADGTRLATASHGETGVPLMSWTLADGKLESPTARVIDSRRYQWPRKSNPPSHDGIPPFEWCGPRHLLIEGHDVFDFDLGGAAYSLGEYHSVLATGGVRGPDGRAWRVMRPRRDAVDAFKKALPGGGGLYISAVTIPELPADGVACGPNTAYRVAAEGVSSHRQATAQVLADGLAERGLRVDPRADLTACVVRKSITSTRLPYGKVVAPPADPRLMYPHGLVELVDGFDVTFKIDVRAKAGQVLWSTGDWAGGTTDAAGEGRVLAWRSAAAQAAGYVAVSPVILRPGAHRATLPIYLLARPDGTTLLKTVRDWWVRYRHERCAKHRAGGRPPRPGRIGVVPGVVRRVRRRRLGRANRRRRGGRPAGRPRRRGSGELASRPLSRPVRHRRGVDMVDQSWRSLITVEPGKRGGRPCVRGMRITVYDVLSYLAAGLSTQEVLDDFPYLTAADVRACLAFAAERQRGMLVAVA